MVEIKAFIGLIIQMGLVQLSDIKDYWSTHVTMNLPFFCTIVTNFSYILYSDHTDARRKLSHKEFRRDSVMFLCDEQRSTTQPIFNRNVTALKLLRECDVNVVTHETWM